MNLEISDNKHLIIPVGLSGIGKSTYGSENFNDNEIWGYDKTRKLLYGNVLWSRHLDKVAVKTCKDIVETQMKNGVMIYLDNTNLKFKYIQPYLDLAKLYSYEVHFLDFGSQLELAKKRNSERVVRVPNFVIDKQLEKIKAFPWNRAAEHGTVTKPMPIRRVPKTVHTKRAIFIGDIQGMGHKLIAELDKHGFTTVPGRGWMGPPDTKLFFVGDIPDRGDSEVLALRTVKALVDADLAEVVQGNHDRSLARVILSGGSHGKQTQSYPTYELMLSEMPMDEIKEIGHWLDELPLMLRVMVNNEEYCLSHFGTMFWLARKDNSEYLPNGYEAQEIQRGVYTGRQTSAGRRELKHPVENANNINVPYKCVFGHCNLSASEDGSTMKLPFIVENFICLESRVENNENTPVGVRVVE